MRFSLVCVQQDRTFTCCWINMDVVSNGQLGSVQLCYVLITVCTGRDLDPIAKASRGWSARACRRIFRTDSLQNDARLAVMMMVPAFTLDKWWGGRCWRCDECPHDCGWAAQKRFQGFWKERAGILTNIRMSQDARQQSKQRELGRLWGGSSSQRGNTPHFAGALWFNARHSRHRGSWSLEQRTGGSERERRGTRDRRRQNKETTNAQTCDHMWMTMFYADTLCDTWATMWCAQRWTCRESLVWGCSVHTPLLVTVDRYQL